MCAVASRRFAVCESRLSHVLEMLAGGMTPEQVLQDFPYLEKADIDACLEYAARHVAHREIVLGK